MPEKQQELEHLRDVEFVPGTVYHVPLPCLSPRHARFSLHRSRDGLRVELAYRQVMDGLLAAVDERFNNGGRRQHLYVDGPSGSGKSHCMLGIALRLWQRSLSLSGEGQDDRLRVVYIPEWHRATVRSVAKELSLTFSRDADVAAAFTDALTATPYQLNRVLRSFTHWRGGRLQCAEASFSRDVY